jgi:hypothetical protein
MQLSGTQLAANRANAIKSNGPVTPQGKRNSARNGNRHGVLASVLLIEGESRERFLALVDGLYTEYGPVTTTETSLVNKIAGTQAPVAPPHAPCWPFVPWATIPITSTSRAATNTATIVSNTAP